LEAGAGVEAWDCEGGVVGVTGLAATRPEEIAEIDMTLLQTGAYLGAAVFVRMLSGDHGRAERRHAFARFSQSA